MSNFFITYARRILGRASKASEEFDLNLTSKLLVYFQGTVSEVTDRGDRYHVKCGPGKSAPDFYIPKKYAVTKDNYIIYTEGEAITVGTDYTGMVCLVVIDKIPVFVRTPNIHPLQP